MGAKSVYQSEEYRKALEISGKHLISISDSYYAIEKRINLPVFGRKKILESRGIPSKEDAKALKEKSKQYFYCTIAPSVLGEFNVLDETGYGRTDNSTVLINLEQSDEDLWKNLEKKSIRWGVKTAEKNQLEFTDAKQDELEEFYKIYRETTKSGGFESEKREFIEYLVQAGIAKLFLIKKQSRIVAGGMILLDKNYNYTILDITSTTDEGQKLQAMPFLYWKIILYSKNQGYKYFDLGGYDREAKPGEKTYNINKFKERFGGDIVDQPIYSTSWKYSFLRKVLKSFRFLKGAYKKE